MLTIEDLNKKIKSLSAAHDRLRLDHEELGRVHNVLQSRFLQLEKRVAEDQAAPAKRG